LTHEYSSQGYVASATKQIYLFVDLWVAPCHPIINNNNNNNINIKNLEGA